MTRLEKFGTIENYLTEEKKEKYDTMYQNIASYGIMVIPCYFVK